MENHRSLGAATWDANGEDVSFLQPPHVATDLLSDSRALSSGV